MKLKKIISAISAIAMMASMTVVANAASLGGKPTVTAEFVEYTTNSSKSWAKAWVKVTIDMSKAEALKAYTEGTAYDEEEEDDVIVKSGNGLTTIGGQIKVSDALLAPQATNCTVPSTWVMEAKSDYYKLAFGPKSVAAEYYTEGKTELLFNFKVTSANFDKAGEISFADFTLDGTNVDVYNVTNNTSTWSYSQAAGTIDMVGCSIPSYNEWSTPAQPAGPVIDELIDGGDMYGMKTKIAGVSIPETVSASKAVVSLNGQSKEYELPTGVKGASNFIAIIRYAADLGNPAFTLEIK